MSNESKPMVLRDVLAELAEIEELESKSHGLWDNSFSNLAFGRLSAEAREECIQQTYQATRIHAEAMDRLRKVHERLQGVIHGR